MFSVAWQNGEGFEPELGLEFCVSPDTLKTANKTKNSPVSPFSHLKARCFLQFLAVLIIVKSLIPVKKLRILILEVTMKPVAFNEADPFPKVVFYGESLNTVPECCSKQRGNDRFLGGSKVFKLTSDRPCLACT